MRFYVCQYLFTILFQISGIVLLAIGIWLVQEKHHYIALLESGTFPVATYLLLASGGMIIVVGLIGCCGAAKDIRFLLLLVSITPAPIFPYFVIDECLLQTLLH